MLKSGRLLVAAASMGTAFSILSAPVAKAAVTQVGDVFYIAMENHDWTVNGGGFSGNATTGAGSNLALFNNPAAPFLNSLTQPGNPNAAQTSYTTSYYNAGTGNHPSEPNYVWAEAGTNFNPISTGTPTSTTQGTITGNTILNDNDPTVANKNILTGVPHLTGQLNSAGISWQNFQEDYQITSNTVPTGGSPTVSKSGTSTTVINPYYNTGQYNYAVKHNPMAFFADTQTQNVNTFDQLRSDLTADTGPTPVSNFGRYNWVTPNQYDDMHSAIGNFTYHGTTYSGDQSAVATGDNFLATVVPEIEATRAYKNNGAIVIWFDESEGGDSASYTVPEIVISPLAKGNAYASPYAYSHSSDIYTMEELYGLPEINNAIPSSETYAGGGSGYASVATANDLSDLFQPNAVPEPSSLGVLGICSLALLARRRRMA